MLLVFSAGSATRNRARPLLRRLRLPTVPGGERRRLQSVPAAPELYASKQAAGLGQGGDVEGPVGGPHQDAAVKICKRRTRVAAAEVARIKAPRPGGEASFRRGQTKEFALERKGLSEPPGMVNPGDSQEYRRLRHQSQESNEIHPRGGPQPRISVRPLPSCHSGSVGMLGVHPPAPPFLGRGRRAARTFLK